MYYVGTFTRDANVVCCDCASGAKFELHPDNAVTTCDRCGAQIQVTEKVAKEHNLTDHLRVLGFDAYMEQTGGMCSACCIYCENSNNDIAELLITYQLYDGGFYCIEAYDYDGDIVETDWDNIEFKTQDELAAWLCSNHDKF